MHKGCGFAPFCFAALYDILILSFYVKLKENLKLIDSLFLLI